MISRSYALGIGLLSLTLATCLIVTGATVLLSLRGALDHAYTDILELRSVATVGVLLDLHLWGSVGLAVVLGFHVLVTRRVKVGRVLGISALMVAIVLAVSGLWCESPMTAVAQASAQNKDGTRATPFLGYEGPKNGAGRSNPAMSLANLSRFLAMPLVVGVLLAAHWWRLPKSAPSNQKLQQTGPA